MKTKPKNPVVKDLMGNLRNQAVGKEAPIWKTVARLLDRPRRREVKVNLYSIEKGAKAKEHVVVPGTVLGSGSINKAVNVAALRFSAASRQKIEKAGGKCMTIQDLAKANPTGKGVRILG